MIDLAGVEIEAVSIAGQETCIEVPELKFAFDIGRAPPSVLSRKTILFTHPHMDHMAGIAWHAALRALRAMPPPTYVVPKECAEDVAALFDVWRRLDVSELPHELVPLGIGEEHALAKGYLARPFRSPHRIRCQGYGIWRVKRKLKPELEGVAEHEIAQLRRRGTEVTNVFEIPELAFTGDTRIEVVEQEEVVRKARRLIMESTFLDERVPVERARATGHVHLDEIIERADLFENEVILLTHFSARYKAAEIVNILDRRLPGHLRERVVPLVSGHA